MNNNYLIRFGKIKKHNGILNALKHNKRELLANADIKHINNLKTALNYSLTKLSSALEVTLEAKSKMILAGIEKPRKNAVMAIEIIFSLPIEWHKLDSKAFFEDCYQWTLKTFKVPLLSFDVHLDESAPHAHAILLPLVEGKMQGNLLVGGIGNIKRLNNLYFKEVAQKHGLKGGNPANMKMNDNLKVAREVLDKLKHDSIKQSSVYACIRDSIFSNPIPYAEMLGLKLSNHDRKTNKSFVDIKRSRGKGDFIR